MNWWRHLLSCIICILYREPGIRVRFASSNLKASRPVPTWIHFIQFNAALHNSINQIEWIRFMSATDAIASQEVNRVLRIGISEARTFGSFLCADTKYWKENIAFHNSSPWRSSFRRQCFATFSGKKIRGHPKKKTKQTRAPRELGLFTLCWEAQKWLP